MPKPTVIDSDSRQALSAAQAELQVHLGQLRHWSGRAIPAQVAAVAAVEGVIVLAAKQQTGWGRLRLIALRALGMFLRSIERQGRGRPRKKMSDADILPPTYADLGITDRHVAADALNVPKIEEHIFQAYMKIDEPTLGGLLVLATEPSHHLETGEVHGYHLSPPELLDYLRTRFGNFWDACPFQRSKGFDSLKMPWPKLTYCNPPFLSKHNADGKGLTAWVRKCIQEARLGKTVLLVLATQVSHNLLLDASEAGGVMSEGRSVTVEMESLGRVKWLHTITGQPHPSPPPAMLVILRGIDVTRDANAYTSIWHKEPEEISDWMIARDPEKASKVALALLVKSAKGARMLHVSALFFSDHLHWKSCVGPLELR